MPQIQIVFIAVALIFAHSEQGRNQSAPPTDNSAFVSEGTSPQGDPFDGGK